jgi:transposase
MAPALKGDSKSGNRAIARRSDDQNRRACRCARQSGALHPAAGSAADSVGVEPLIAGVAIGALLADKAFDNNWLRAELNRRGVIAVIPPKADRKDPIGCDLEMYKWRHLIENFFCKLKEFRRIATRYEKTDTSYSAMIHLVGSAIAIR